MAIIQLNGPTGVIQSADDFYLGNASDSFVGMYAVMLVSNSFSGSITVKARIGSPYAAAVAPVPILYVSRYLNGAISTDGLLATPITTTSLILVPASGQMIVLSCGTFTSGSMSVYKMPVMGATA